MVDDTDKDTYQSNAISDCHEVAYRATEIVQVFSEENMCLRKKLEKCYQEIKHLKSVSVHFYGLEVRIWTQKYWFEFVFSGRCYIHVYLNFFLWAWDKAICLKHVKLYLFIWAVSDLAAHSRT